MNRIKKWLEQNPQRMLFIKIGLVFLGIILLIALPTLYLVLSGFGIWYLVFCKEGARYSKKKSNDWTFRCQYCCSLSPNSDSHKENFIFSIRN